MERLILLLILVPGFLLQVSPVHGDVAAEDASKTGLRAFTIFPAVLAESLYSDDPCQLRWVECSSDDPSRVIATDLSGRELYGKLPDFSSLDALETIDFHDNQLFGSIPDFIGTFPKLQKLDLSNNDFSGTIPKSILANSNLQKDFSGNPRLCSSGSCQKSPAKSNQDSGSSTTYSSDTGSGQNKQKKVVGLAVSPFLVIWAAVGGFLIMKHKERVQAAIQGRLRGANGQADGKMIDQMGQEQPEKDYVPLRP